MWKFGEFSVVQILRELYFGACRSSKIALLAVLVALNSILLVKCAKIHNIKIQCHQMCSMC